MTKNRDGFICEEGIHQHVVEVTLKSGRIIELTHGVDGYKYDLSNGLAKPGFTYKDDSSLEQHCSTYHVPKWVELAKGMLKQLVRHGVNFNDIESVNQLGPFKVEASSPLTWVDGAAQYFIDQCKHTAGARLREVQQSTATTQAATHVNTDHVIHTYRDWGKKGTKDHTFVITKSDGSEVTFTLASAWNVPRFNPSWLNVQATEAPYGVRPGTESLPHGMHQGFAHVVARKFHAMGLNVNTVKGLSVDDKAVGNISEWFREIDTYLQANFKKVHQGASASLRAADHRAQNARVDLFAFLLNNKHPTKALIEKSLYGASVREELLSLLDDINKARVALSKTSKAKIKAAHKVFNDAVSLAFKMGGFFKGLGEFFKQLVILIGKVTDPNFARMSSDEQERVVDADLDSVAGDANQHNGDTKSGRAHSVFNLRNNAFQSLTSDTDHNTPWSGRHQT